MAFHRTLLSGARRSIAILRGERYGGRGKEDFIFLGPRIEPGAFWIGLGVQEVAPDSPSLILSGASAPLYKTEWSCTPLYLISVRRVNCGGA